MILNGGRGGGGGGGRTRLDPGNGRTTTGVQLVLPLLKGGVPTAHVITLAITTKGVASGGGPMAHVSRSKGP